MRVTETVFVFKSQTCSAARLLSITAIKRNIMAITDHNISFTRYGFIEQIPGQLLRLVSVELHRGDVYSLRCLHSLI